MIPAQQIHDWARFLPPSDLGGAAIVIGAASALGFALLRARKELPRSLPALCYLALATATACGWLGQPLPLAPLIYVLLLASLWLHFRLDRGDLALSPRCGRDAVPPDPAAFSPSIEDPFRPAPATQPQPLPAEEEEETGAWGARVALALGFLASAVLLVDQLGTYAGTLQAWESPVVLHGFAAAVAQNVDLWSFTRERLLWDDGVLSAGHTSLFYGPPTLALFRAVAASPLTLRLASVVATLLSMAVLFSLVRRYCDRTTATASVLLFGLNTPVLFYGRYGSSIAGTVLAVLLAVYATWFFLERSRHPLLRAILCGAALFVATLQYAPGRLAVLFLLGLIPFALVFERRRGTWTRWLGALLIALMAAGVWSYESSQGRKDYFLHGRGEQVFGMLRNPNTIPALVGTEKRFTPGRLDRDQQIEVVRMVVSKTWNELVGLLSPDPRPRSNGAVVTYDPPDMSLYFAPAAALIGLGLARSLTFWRSWQHLAPLLFTIAYSATLLFTNRIDSHRGILLMIPVALWFGIGAREALRLAERLRVPAPLTGVLAFVFLTAAVYADVDIRYKARPAIGRVLEELVEEIDAIPGPLGLWFGRDHRDLAWLGLHLLDAELRKSDGRGGILPQALTDGLRSDKGGPRTVAVRQATRQARRSTLLLGPKAMFLEAAQQLQLQGLRVAERNAAGFRYYRVDGGARRTGIPDRQFRPLSKVTPPPTPAPIVLTEGPRLYLSDMKPNAVKFGFAEPRMDATWQGRPVVMGGIEYPKAIGTHSWTSMRFDVPKDAIALQAVIGLSDEIRACEAASVEFEVRGADNSVLWKSDVIDFASRPMSIEVPVVHQGRITLVTTEADDGRDCDHANWGSAAFLLRKHKPLDQLPVVRGGANDAR